MIKFRYFPPVIWIFAILFLGLAGVFISIEQKQLLISSQVRLSSIAESKATQISEYRKASLADGMVLSTNTAFRAAIQNLVTNPDSETDRKYIESRLAAYTTLKGYMAAYFIDTRQQILAMYSSELHEVSPSQFTLDYLKTQNKAPAVSDAYICKTYQNPEMEFYTPIYASVSNTDHYLGLLVFKANLKNHIYPILGEITALRKTGEAHILVRGRDTIHYLSKPRFTYDKVDLLTVSTSSPKRIEAKITTYPNQLYYGQDYRDKHVLALAVPIENSAWYLMVKADQKEVQHSLYSFSFLIFGIAFFAFLILAVSWQYHAYRKQAQEKQIHTSEELRALEETKRHVQIELEKEQLHRRELEVLSRVALTLNASQSVDEINRYIAKTVHLMTNDIVLISRIDELDEYLQLIEVWGIDDQIPLVTELIGFNPLDIKYWLKDINQADLELFTSNVLTEPEGGLHAVTFRQISVSDCEKICSALQIHHVYTMGFTAMGKLVGGFTILSRMESIPFRTAIETMINTASTAIYRVRAEQMLANFNAELEQTIAERTAQLQIAIAELDSYNYSVSHDLMAPLRTIDGFCKAIQEDFAQQLEGSGMEYFTRIRRAADSMAVIIEDLLKLARISQIEVHAETINMSKIIKSLTHEMVRENPQRNFEIKIAESIEVSADMDLMRIAMKSLLSNCLKFTVDRDVSVIEFGTTVIAEQTVYFIKDNGVGFDMKYQESLFSPFKRLHRKKLYPGTGIGLSVVKRIIGMHEGKIWLESAVDVGTVVYFTVNG
jgi:signal transduction histidine kinase